MFWLFGSGAPPSSKRPNAPTTGSNLAVAYKRCNTKRGRWAKVPDPEAPPQREPVRTSPAVGERIAEILSADR